MKTTVIYHSADYDGIFCREIARKFLPDAELIGWNFGDSKIPLPKTGPVYVFDLPIECLDVDLALKDYGKEWHRISWIDHHKTSIDKWDSGLSKLTGLRIDGVAACRLAWQYFTKLNRGESISTLTKQLFIDRKVEEPIAVRLAGEYDIWDKRDPDAETFQYGLRGRELTNQIWNTLLSFNGGKLVENMLSEGASIQRYQQNIDSDLVKYRSYRLTFEGLKFIVLNTGRFNSLTFSALDIPETGHDALLGYMFNGKVWTVSLYHAKHRTDLDLSEIAKKHGGGGHRGACGFTCEKFPVYLTP